MNSTNALPSQSFSFLAESINPLSCNGSKRKGASIIDNKFIDEHIRYLSGDCTKILLWLMSHDAGFKPTLQMIAEFVDITKRTALKCLHLMKQYGYIQILEASAGYANVYKLTMPSCRGRKNLHTIGNNNFSYYMSGGSRPTTKPQSAPTLSCVSPEAIASNGHPLRGNTLDDDTWVNCGNIYDPRNFEGYNGPTQADYDAISELFPETAPNLKNKDDLLEAKPKQTPEIKPQKPEKAKPKTKPSPRQKTALDKIFDVARKAIGLGPKQQPVYSQPTMKAGGVITELAKMLFGDEGMTYKGSYQFVKSLADRYGLRITATSLIDLSKQHGRYFDMLSNADRNKIASCVIKAYEKEKFG